MKRKISELVPDPTSTPSSGCLLNSASGSLTNGRA